MSSVFRSEVRDDREEPHTRKSEQVGPSVLLVAGSREELAVVRSAVAAFAYRVEAMLLGQLLSDLGTRAYDIALACVSDPGAHWQQAVELIKARLGVPVLCLVPFPTPEQISMISRCPGDDLAFLPVRSEEVGIRIDLLVRKSRQRAELAYPLIERRRARESPTRLPVDADRLPTSPTLYIDDREKKVVIGERHVRLSPKQYGLLALLASDPGKVFSAREILARLWPDKPGRESDVAQYVFLLRRKIEADPAQPKWLLTEQGFGYKLNLP